jgi:hypothetical protein
MSDSTPTKKRPSRSEFLLSMEAPVPGAPKKKSRSTSSSSLLAPRRTLAQRRYERAMLKAEQEQEEMARMFREECVALAKLHGTAIPSPPAAAVLPTTTRSTTIVLSDDEEEEDESSSSAKEELRLAVTRNMQRAAKENLELAVAQALSFCDEYLEQDKLLREAERYKRREETLRSWVRLADDTRELAALVDAPAVASAPTPALPEDDDIQVDVFQNLHSSVERSADGYRRTQTEAIRSIWMSNPEQDERRDAMKYAQHDDFRIFYRVSWYALNCEGDEEERVGPVLGLDMPQQVVDDPRKLELRIERVCESRKKEEKKGKITVVIVDE